MEIIRNENIKIRELTAVTLGNFDGIHLGHQQLIKTVKKYSEEEELTSVVFSFYPHPATVINPQKDFRKILSEQERYVTIEKLGIDILIEYPFTKKFADTAPEDFMEMLFKTVNCKVLVVGEGYCFGRHRTGTYETLKQFGDDSNREINVIKIPDIVDDGTRISSSRIRQCIYDENFDEANRLLGKPYFLTGTVVKGKRIGKGIGFPTANIIPPEQKLIPPDGVYITRTVIDDKTYNSMTNIGNNPTTNGTKKTVETFIFDFDKDLYGKEITVLFYEGIRNVKKFPTVLELKKQLTLDYEQARAYLDNKLS